jgi:hypothetical protein
MWSNRYAMGREPGATVVPFPAGQRVAGPEHPARTGSPAVVIRPWDDRDADADAGRNESWDELLRLVDQAWAWRDPETLSQIEASLLRLGITIEADWS